MNSSDFFYYSVAIGFIVAVGIFGYVAFQFILTLKSLRRVLGDIEDTTHGIKLIKNSFQQGILSFLGNLLGKPKRGGGKSGKSK